MCQIGSNESPNLGSRKLWSATPFNILYRIQGAIPTPGNPFPFSLPPFFLFPFLLSFYPFLLPCFCWWTSPWILSGCTRKSMNGSYITPVESPGCAVIQNIYCTWNLKLILCLNLNRCQPRCLCVCYSKYQAYIQIGVIFMTAKLVKISHLFKVMTDLIFSTV